MAKDFFGRLEETISTTGKAAAQKAKEVADSAKRHNDLRVAILRFSNRRLKAKKMNSRMAKTSKNNETNKNSRESL